MNKVIVKIDAPELQVLEKSKAEQIKKTFEPMADLLTEFEDKYNKLIADANNEITSNVISRAKRLRLDIGQVRIKTGKLKDKQKEYIKLEDKAIMGVHNILVWAVKEKEDKLKEIEKHFEIKKQERLEKLQSERAELLSAYIDDAHERDLSKFADDEFEALLAMKKKEYEDKIAAEKKAEEERIAKEKADKLRLKRKDEALPYYQYWSEFEKTLDFAEVSEKDFNDFMKRNINAKKEDDEKKEKQRIENERLKKEAELKEKEHKKGIEKRRIDAIKFLFDEGFENTHNGMQAKKYHHFIGALHYSQLETDKELEMFKKDVLSTKLEQERKAKKDAERKIREEKERKEREEYEAKLKAEREEKERIEREEKAKRKKLETELKAKEEAERKAKELEEQRIQAELNKGDEEKVKDLINDLNELKSKYTFKSVKYNKVYKDVKDLLDKVVNHINEKK
jgi:hypothetical protein